MWLVFYFTTGRWKSSVFTKGCISDPGARARVHPLLGGSTWGGQLSDQLLDVNHKTS